MHAATENEVLSAGESATMSFFKMRFDQLSFFQEKTKYGILTKILNNATDYKECRACSVVAITLSTMWVRAFLETSISCSDASK